jgi:hypothetical protein
MKGALAKDFGLKKYVDELRQYDHAFLTVEGAEYFSKPFGFTAYTHVEKADPTAIKGLTLNNGAKQGRGIGAHQLAAQICRHVGVAYEEKFGRGSQLRACCDALEQWLES